MVTFFNFNTLMKESRGSRTKFLTLLDILYSKKLPNKKSGIQVTNKNLVGDSFILNLQGLIDATKYIDINYIIQYLDLCSKRDYALYKLYGTKSLLLAMYPDINIEVIKHNPLLNITENEIQFKYEQEK